MRNASKQSETPRARLAAAARRATPSIEPVERRVLMSATPGSLDAAFGTAGALTVSGGVVPTSLAIATQANGDVIVAAGGGGAGAQFVARYTSAGALDATFGTNGATSIDDFFPSQAAVVANGDVLLFGQGASLPELVELTSTGAINTAYGTNGIVSLVNSRSVAISPDGSAYAVENLDAVAKYTPDGLLDPTYGNAGITPLTAGTHNTITSAVIAVDGSGDATVGFGYSVNGTATYGYGTTAVTPSGVEYTNSILTLGGFTSQTSHISVTAIALDQDGVGAYVAAQQGSSSTVSFATSSFGEKSPSVVFAGSITNLAVQADGKLIAAGTVPGTPGGMDATPATDAWVERFAVPNQGLVADTTFGSGGVAKFNFDTTDTPAALAVNANGDILLGEATLGRASNRFTVAALFGGPGTVIGSVSNGVLTVNGTSGDDTIAVSNEYDATSVYVNGSQQAFPDGTVTSIVVNAGDGDDSVSVYSLPPFDYELPSVSVSGGEGNDTLTLDGDERTTLDGGDGNDMLSAQGTYGTSATLLGGAGDDEIIVGDLVTVNADGGAGDDYVNLQYGGFGDTVVGGVGTDTLSIDDSQTSGNVVVNLDGRADSTSFGGYPGSSFGADFETLGVNFGSAMGTLAVDGDGLGDSITVSSNLSPVTVNGGAGNDRIVGFSSGGSAHLTLNGNGGNDTLIDTDGNTSFSGGAGTDTVDFSSLNVAVTAYLGGNAPSGTAAQIAAGTPDYFDGTVEIVDGSDAPDFFVAAPGGGDSLYGNGGNDTLTAQGGADALFGGAGNDVFNADDGGATTLDGGADMDTAFVDPTGDEVTNVESTTTDTTETPAAGRLAGSISGPTGAGTADPTATVFRADDGDLTTFLDAPSPNGNVVTIDLGSAKTVGKIGYAPRPGYGGRMDGGVFQASNTADFSSGVVTAYTIHGSPTSGVLTTATPATTAAYRYWRYVAPLNSFGNIAEFQLFAPTSTTPTPTGTQLTGTTYGTAGSGTNTVAKATDGSLATYYDSPTGSGGYVAIDLGSAKAVSQIKFAPRSGWASRMVGGRFQASNTADFSSGVVTVYTVTTAPATGSLTTVSTGTATAYRYWRYIGASYTYSDIAEFQLFGTASTTPTPTPTPTQLTGTTYGTAGSGTNTVAKATDGSLATFFDSPAGSGGYVAIDLGSAKAVSQIKFAPRSGWASRMVGGRFQASNTADFSSGVVTVYTVAAAPATGSLTTVSTGTATAYRYWRYIGANYTYSDIAEFQLFA